MKNSARSLLLQAVLIPLALFGCGSDKATGPRTADFVLGVAGLPPGSLADILVTGPGGFTASVSATDTLEKLAPGDYVVTARGITHGGDEYAASQPVQTIAVTASKQAMNARVNYAIASGRLTITLTGLQGSPGDAISVSGPNGFARAIQASSQITRLQPGTYTITAGTVTSGLQVYVPDQATRSINVSASNSPAAVTIAYTPSTGLNLIVESMYITQSVQRRDGSIPLIRGRDGFLRIFGRANVSNGAVVPVRVRFFMNGAQVNEVTLPAGSSSVAHDIDEGSLQKSWNVPVSGSMIQPGLSVLAEIDPGNVVAEVSEGDNRFPASGTPRAMNVVSAPVFSVRFVPIRTDSTNLTGNVTEANKHQFMTVAQKIHPIPGYDADVRAIPYTTTAPPLQSGNDNSAWSTILSEINALRIAEGSTRYYYGVVGTTYNSGVAGIGYVPGRAALGWDKLPSAAGVLAHEIGHNWGRRHAPCGGVGNPDPQYPHGGGLIGAFGFDVASGTVQNASTQTDIMGYCNNQWISDYTYLGILNHRGSEAGNGTAEGQAEAVVVGDAQPSLLVWGRIVDGTVILEPAFELVTRPAMPAGSGPYTIEGIDASGGRVFSISFAGDPVADSEKGERQFAFAIPLSADRASRLTTVRAVGQGGGARQGTAAQAAPEAVPTAQAFAGDRVRVRWNARNHPMLLVRDAESGEVLSFARGGEVTVKTRDRELELVVSAGARSRTRLTKVELQ